MVSILVIQLFCSLFMTGALWIKQIVMYPSLALIPSESFSCFEILRQKRVKWVLYPVVGTELFTGLVLMTQDSWIFKANFALILFIWFISFTVYYPIMRKLREGKDDELINNLVKINWLKTVAWSVKSILLLSL